MIPSDISGWWRRTWVAAGWLALSCLAVGAVADRHERPNVLWITSEDNGPHLGCYGDRLASTPALDALAARGMRYDRVWSVAPVCAPARTAIISGLYPGAAGAGHMRSEVPLPPGFRMFPQFLREAGYYCSNNSKEDYNLVKPGQVWDESSPRAHWRQRPAGTPFFAVFNFTETHESQIRRRPHAAQTDPARVRVPAYHPDTPEVRRDRAQYYDQLAAMDRRAGAVLAELDAAGLAGDTIVFYFGDHGPGLPGGKRSVRDAGLRVPLIVYFPPRWRHLAPPDYREGGRSDRLVSFVDLAPTMLSLAGLRPPGWMQGHAFAGGFKTPAPTHLFGQRGRMDERTDLVRAVTDGRFVYVRNYHPDRPAGQHVAYMFETPTTLAWAQRFRDGRLPPEQAAFWLPRPAEELYDLTSDPDEVRNLATSPAHRRTLERLRRLNRDHLRQVRDIEFLPEPEMLARSGSNAPYTLARDRTQVRLDQVQSAAEEASKGWWPGRPLSLGEVRRLERLTASPEAGVRYWGVVGLRLRGEEGVRRAETSLRHLLSDPSPSVRVAAAETLAVHGNGEIQQRAIEELLRMANVEQNEYGVAVEALQALDRSGTRAHRHAHVIRELPTNRPGIPPRMGDYAERLVRHLQANLPGTN